MDRPHSMLMIGLIALCLAGAPAWSQAKEPAPPAAKPAEVKNPLEDETPNPLTEVDPFAGEYEGDEVIAIIKVAGDGYVGEIRRAGRSFPMKATRDGKQIAGTFTHESTTFKFTAGFEGAALKMASGSKVFILKRKEEAAAPGPARPSPLPPISPPAAQPVTPPRDPAVKLRRADMPAAVDYAKLSSQQIADAVWTRFLAGTYVVVEDAVSSSQAIGATSRRKMLYTGESNGHPIVRSHRWDGGQWVNPDLPAPRPEDCQRADELGYAKGQTRAETIAAAGRMLTCQRTTYTGEATVKDGTMKLVLDVWRSSQVDHPAIVLDLPGKRLLVGPDVARVTIASELKGLKASMELNIEAMERDTQIGDQIVVCTVLKGIATNDFITPRSAVAKSVLTTEYWLSHQVPGGVARRVEADETGPRRRTQERNVIEFSQGK